MNTDKECKRVRKKLAAVDDALLYMSQRKTVLRNRIDCLRTCMNADTKEVLWELYDEIVCELDTVTMITKGLIEENKELNIILHELQKGETW